MQTSEKNFEGVHFYRILKQLLFLRLKYAYKQTESQLSFPFRLKTVLKKKQAEQLTFGFMSLFSFSTFLFLLRYFVKRR